MNTKTKQNTSLSTSMPANKVSTFSKIGSITSKLLSNLLGEGKELRRYWSIVDEVLALENKMSQLKDEELKAKTKEFREQLKGLKGKQIQKALEKILPEAFAVVREATWRTLKIKQFPVQILGAIVLNEGRIAEMKTGEGKTLVAPLAAYLNALPEQSQVHIVTVNEYLARVGASWMGQVFDFLGMSVGVIQANASFYFQKGAYADEESEKKRSLGRVETWEDGEQQDARAVLDVKHLVNCDRKRAYFDEERQLPVDIVYGVNSEFGFDYLRDNMVENPDDIVQKSGHIMAIIDEVDSILIDEARTPLIISSQDEDSSNRYKQFAKLVKQLNPELDYSVNEKRRFVTLTELGVEKVERLLGIKNLYEDESHAKIIYHLDLALKALNLFRKEKEYVVKNGEVIIVDENTGRLMFGRRYNSGLHQAIEAKEGLPIQAENKTTATITFQNYFRMYKKLSGMTGTAATESEELYKIYKLLVVTIPTNKPVIRIDKVDLVYKNEASKFKAIVQEVKNINQKGQPILIGTTSIEKNILLSNLLTEAGVEHQVLNAKNHEQEARIIANAGKKGAVTVATNIAGRGVDIKLGGEPPEDLAKLEEWKKEHEEVKALGGLYVIGTERHESRRIDNQLRGRSGRQGDPGVSQFYVSLDDYVIRVFGGDNVEYYKKLIPVGEDEALQYSIISKTIQQAQKKIEGYNFDIRRYVTEYDDVINKQRMVVYKLRYAVLTNQNFSWKEDIEKTLQRHVLKTIQRVSKTKKKEKYRELVVNCSKDLKEIVNIKDFQEEILEIWIQDYNFNYKKMTELVTKKILQELDKKWINFSEEDKSAMVRFIYLRAIDTLWTEHLVTIEDLQSAISLKRYSQKDPLTEFKEEAMNVFINLLQEIDKEICNTLFKIDPDYVPAGIRVASKNQIKSN